MTTIADFAYPDKKLLIYIDGYTYHKDKGQGKIDLDRRQELILRASGYEVIRIGAKDLDDDEMMNCILSRYPRYLTSSVPSRKQFITAQACFGKTFA